METSPDTKPRSLKRLWVILFIIGLVTSPIWGWFLFKAWAWVDLREDRHRLGLMQQEAVLTSP